LIGGQQAVTHPSSEESSELVDKPPAILGDDHQPVRAEIKMELTRRPSWSRFRHHTGVDLIRNEGKEGTVAWRWTARRLVISAFVLFHLSALMIWTMPSCYIKDRFNKPFHYYVLPLGIWQWWAIFAPEPVRDTTVVNAEVVDVKGIRHIHEFPRVRDLSWWSRIPRYRNPKFTNNMISD